MKIRIFTVAVFLLVSSAALAQDIYPTKDLAFAQVAAGAGYETVLNVTNRGTSPYAGTLSLFRSSGAAWSVLVNGNPVNGTMNLVVNPGATISLRITLGDASLGVQSGFAVIHVTDYTQTSIIEGTLTYYVKSANGTILDSIGVAPSNEVIQAVIPFDDFTTIALAMANINAAGLTANVKLTLFDDKNTQMGAAATQTLPVNNQVPRYLYQYFPGVTLTKGRVEIQSDQLILGTALTFTNNQYSSLPFVGGVKAYNYSISAGSIVTSGQFFIRVDSPYVTGFADGEIMGNVHNGNLRLYAHGNGGQPTEYVMYAKIPAFDPSKATQSGPIIYYYVNPAGVAGQGTVTLTAIN